MILIKIIVNPIKIKIIIYLCIDKNNIYFYYNIFFNKNILYINNLQVTLCKKKAINLTSDIAQLRTKLKLKISK